MRSREEKEEEEEEGRWPCGRGTYYIFYIVYFNYKYFEDFGRDSH